MAYTHEDAPASPLPLLDYRWVRRRDMATAWLTEGDGDDLLDLGDVSPFAAPSRGPTTTLECSPLGEISPATVNQQAVPVARQGTKPFPFAPSPVVKCTRLGSTAITVASPQAFTTASSPSPLGKRASPEPNSLAMSPPDSLKVDTANTAGGSQNPASVPSPVFKPPPGLRVESDKTLGVPLESAPKSHKLTRRRSLGLDAFQGLTSGKGLLDDDDDFDFAPSFTPKAGKGKNVFAPSPVREEEEEEEEEEVEEEVEAEVVPSPVPPVPEASPQAKPVSAEKTILNSAKPPQPSTADEEFERKLQLAMELAERGGGLAGLLGGIANSPPAGANPSAQRNDTPKTEEDGSVRDDDETLEGHSDDDTVELQPDVDVSMMDCCDIVEEETSGVPEVGDGETNSPTRDSPKAPAAVLAALLSPVEVPVEVSEENNKVVSVLSPEQQKIESKPSSLDDSFERKLQAAMDAAERGGGLSGLSGGMQNSPPGSKQCAGAVVPAPTPVVDVADEPVVDVVAEQATGECLVDEEADKKPKWVKKAAPPKKENNGTDATECLPNAEATASPPFSPQTSTLDDSFERKLSAAMAAAEKGGGLGGLSGGMQNSPPGSKPTMMMNSPPAPEVGDCLPVGEEVDDKQSENIDVCGMDHDAAPTPGPRKGGALVELSPVAVAQVSEKKPKSKKVKKVTPKKSVTPEPKPCVDGDEKETEPTPPAVDFEAMLAKAMAAADGGSGDLNQVLGGASSKMMNSPLFVRRRTQARAAKKIPWKTPEKTPDTVTAVENTPIGRATRASTRVTRASAVKSAVKLSEGEVVSKNPTSKKSKTKKQPKPEWVSNSDSVDLALTPNSDKSGNANGDTSLDASDVSNVYGSESSPIPDAPEAPPPPPVAWLKKAAAAKAKPEWVGSVADSSSMEPSHVKTRDVPIAAPVVPLGAQTLLAALAAAQDTKGSLVERGTAFDFEQKLLAAMAAESQGGAGGFGGASKVCNSPVGGKNSGQENQKFSVKEEARRQGVTVAQLMHARAHAESSPLTKVRF